MFVSTVTVKLKSPDFHFLNKEYPLVCATDQFDLIFLNSASYNVQECLKHPGGYFIVLQNKIFKIARNLNALKFCATNNFPKLSHATLNYTLLLSDRKRILEIRPLMVQELKP